MVSFPDGSSTPTNKFYICKTVSVTESSKKTKAPVRHLEGHPLLWLPLSLRQLVTWGQRIYQNSWAVAVSIKRAYLII